MRIALAILHADPARGGAERYTIDLAAALGLRGHEVSLLATSFAGEGAAKQVRLSGRGLTKRGKYLSFLDSLDEHVAEQGYDVVHAMLPVRRCDVYHPHAGIAAGMARAGDWVLRPRRGAMAEVERELLSGKTKRQGGKGRQWDKETRGQGDRETGERGDAGTRGQGDGETRGRGDRETGGRGDEGTRGQGDGETRGRGDEGTPGRGPVVLCLSEYVKEAIRRVYELSEDRLATLFNAVDLERFDPELGETVGRERGGCTALMIANDFERKGLGPAIEAVGRVGEGLKLVVVGKEDAGRYRELAAKAGAAVEFAGAAADPRPFYRSADFFVLPTRHDPCSLVVLESLAMGLPVISTRYNGACEIMTDDVHGYVLNDPEDVDALAGAMRRMLDPEVRGRMREACLALRPRLSYEHHLDELLGIYERVRSRSSREELL